MSATAPLVIPRRLAIQLLHEAQVAAPESIDGIVTGADGEPQHYLPAAHASGHTAWARVLSYPAAPAEPTLDQVAAGQLTLLISLDIKGVLELRAWTLAAGVAAERTIAIRD